LFTLPDPDTYNIGDKLVFEESFTEIVTFKNVYEDYHTEDGRYCCYGNARYYETRRVKWINETTIDRIRTGKVRLTAECKFNVWKAVAVVGSGLAIIGGVAAICVGGTAGIIAGVATAAAGVAGLIVALAMQDHIWEISAQWMSYTDSWEWWNQWTKYEQYTYKYKGEECGCTYDTCKEIPFAGYHDMTKGRTTAWREIGKSNIDHRSSSNVNDVPGRDRGRWKSSWEN
jgi:hypothetical protein